MIGEETVLQQSPWIKILPAALSMQKLGAHPREDQMTSDRQERIRQRAYEIWQREGERHGSHEQHWEQATREIDAEDDQSASFAQGGKTTSSVADEYSPAEQVAGAGPAVAQHSKDMQKPKRQASKPKSKD
jgi:hypothetical protein